MSVFFYSQMSMFHFSMCSILEAYAYGRLCFALVVGIL